MKKILSAALSISMLASLLAFSASADTPALVSAEDIAVMSVEQIAYLDVETAAPAVQDAILEARAEIIYGDQAWTVDGAVTVFNIKTGTVTELPEFSDLYPGWDIPERNISMAPTGIPCMTTYSSAAGILIEKIVSLQVASAFTASQDFTGFTGDGNPVYVYAVTAPKDARYNVGFSDAVGSNIGWIPNIEHKAQQAMLNTSYNAIYRVRASVPQAQYADQYKMRVTSDPHPDYESVSP